MTQTTGVTSSSSRGAALYFECLVVMTGVIGTAANALILYALVASKQHKKHALIVNQNALDLCTCLFLVITYAMKLANVQLTGSRGYWLCMLILSENLILCVMCGSSICCLPRRRGNFNSLHCPVQCYYGTQENYPR